MNIAFRIPHITRLIAVCAIILAASAGARAQGDLLISPLRIVFDGNKKSQEINLANVGKDTAVYAISVVDYRMREDGGFEEVKTPDEGQRFAGPYLRFFPRKVTLAPNEAQVVKIQLIKTNELTPGEYRSHLYFRAVPEERPQGEAPVVKDTGISIKLKPIFGISIAVIIRVGDCKSEVSISDISFSNAKADTPALKFNLNRTGNISAYGDLKVEHIAPSGKVKQVLLTKGLGIYTPNPLRRISTVLDTDKGVDYSHGKLHITYSMQMSDKSTKVTEAELQLN